MMSCVGRADAGSLLKKLLGIIQTALLDGDYAENVEYAVVSRFIFQNFMAELGGFVVATLAE